MGAMWRWKEGQGQARDRRVRAERGRERGNYEAPPKREELGAAEGILGELGTRGAEGEKAEADEGHGGPAVEEAKLAGSARGSGWLLCGSVRQERRLHAAGGLAAEAKRRVERI